MENNDDGLTLLDTVPKQMSCSQKTYWITQCHTMQIAIIIASVKEFVACVANSIFTEYGNVRMPSTCNLGIIICMSKQDGSKCNYECKNFMPITVEDNNNQPTSYWVRSGSI